MVRAIAIAAMCAALLSASAVEAGMLDSLSQCIQGGTIKKSRVQHTTTIHGVIKCSSDTAKELYGAVRPYSKEIDGVLENADKVHSRFFGERSQCVRVYEAADGSPLDSYTCYIHLDFGDSVVAAMGDIVSQ